MKIKDILELPVNTSFGGSALVVKTAKKTWKLGTYWMQQVLFADDTGQILADMKIVKYNPITRGAEINILEADIRLDENDKKFLFVHRFYQPYDIGEPPLSEWQGESLKIVKGKIKTWLMAAKIQSGASDDECLKFAEGSILKKILDSILDA